MRFTTSLPRRSVITTDEVLSELLAYCASDPHLRSATGLAVENLLNNPDIQVVPQSRTS
jgi:hypothetical protein